MIGRTISHYQILEKLGAGGMGVVYKAKDLKLDRCVALKFLPPALSFDIELKERFIHEAKAASALDHRNICTIHEISETDDKSGLGGEQLFIVMSCYDGETLKKKIEGGPLNLNEAVDIFIQIAEGLQKAHALNIIHRDIKPANIFITKDGVVKILDFGLAKVSDQTRLTNADSTAGTVSYMSPEQTKGGTVDQRSDIWSLGVILFEMITGDLPFKGDYEHAVIYSILNQEIERGNIPDSLYPIVLKCLAKDAGGRYKNAADLIEDMKKIQGSKNGVGTKGKNPLNNIIRKKNSKYLTIFEFTALLMVLIIVGYFLFEPEYSNMNNEGGSAYDSDWESSIAVLPFRGINPQNDQEFLTDGMTDAINDKLTQFDKLKVISTTSVMRFKNTQKDIKEIGNELGVANVLEGTIQKEENKIRVRAKLSSTMTGFQIWSHTYDKDMKSLFDLQDEISNSIAGALKLQFVPQAESVNTKTYPVNMEAYEDYLKGMHYIKSKYVISFEEEDFRSGVALFEKVIQIEPENALAYYGLAWAYEHHYQVTGSKEDAELSRRMCEKTYNLDSTSAGVNALMGYYLYEYKSEYDSAFMFLKRGIELNPNLGEVNFLVGMVFLYHGLYEHARKYLSRAVDLDPLYLWCPYKLAWCCMGIGEYDKADYYFKKYFELAPMTLMYPGRYVTLKIKMNQLGKVEDMIAEIEKTHPDYASLAYLKALLLAAEGNREEALKLHKNSEIYALLGMNEEAIKALDNEIRKSTSVPYVYYYDLLNNPFYTNLRADEKFQKILIREKEIYDKLYDKLADFL